MQQQGITVEIAIGKFMTKYEILDYIIPYGFSGSTSKKLNIYIDLYGLIRTILSRNYKIIITDYTSIATGIINICAHYRSYFRYLGVHTKFFLISSYNVPADTANIVINIPDKNNSADPYNKTMLEKLEMVNQREIVNLNLELLDLICPYLPDIFYLNTKAFESSVLINHIMNLENSDIPSLIISTDAMPMQLCGIRNNVSMIWPRKYGYKAEDNSLIICNKTHSEHKKSFWNVFAQKTAKTSLFNYLCNVEPSNFALVQAINGMSERNLKSLIDINQLIKILSQVPGYDSCKITPDILFDMTSNKYFDDMIVRGLIEIRYKLIDVDYQYLFFRESIESKHIHYENLDDPSAVQAINDKYFKNNPIDIYRL